MSEMTNNGNENEQIEDEIHEEKDYMVETQEVPNLDGKRESRRDDVYDDINLRVEEKPSEGEVWGWYLYGLCTYFIHTTLLPLVFPLIISQIVALPLEPSQGWDISDKGILCRPKERQLYERLTHQSISITEQLRFSPLEWTSISWAIGLILSSPLLAFISIHLDVGNKAQLIAGAATTIGSFFCLPIGLFKVTWIFPIYIIVIVISTTITTASHTRHHGLMVRGYTGPNLRRNQFQTRREVSSWLSLYATAIGCLGSAIISAFTYHMLRQKDTFMGLWIVSILCGLKWLTGIFHVLTIRPGLNNNTYCSSSKTQNMFSIFKYYHAVGSLVVIFLASFTSMCVFASSVLYLVGEICIEPVHLLYIWLIYFIFPSFAMPLLQPLQHVMKTNAVKMQVLGFLLSLVTSGMAFYFRETKWRNGHLMFFAALQSVSTGILHAFGRVLFVDCMPPGREGVFAIWFSWMKGVGSCVGFAVAATVVPKSVGTSFGVAFCVGIVGVVGLIFGNVSDVGGAIAARHVSEEMERLDDDCSLEDTSIVKEA